MLINDAAEQSIIVAALGEWGNAAVTIVQDVDPDCIFDPVKRKVLRTAQAIWRERGTVDRSSVESRSTTSEEQRCIHDACMIRIIDPKTLPVSVESVARLARLREAAKHARNAEAAISAEDLDAAEESLGKIAGAMVDGRQRRKAERLDSITDRLISKLMTPQEHRGYGLPTGLHAWDRGPLGLLGLHRTHLTVLAARPAMGKTALALNIAWNVAASGTPVVFSCGEMSADELAERLLSHISQVDYSRIRTGRLDNNAHQRVADATEAMRAAPLHIWDAGRVTAPDLLAQCRLVSAKEGQPVGLLVVDYLQRMGCDIRYREPRHKVAHNAEALKSMAQDEHMCVLALAQLNRGLESRADRRPLMADLREAGEIEQEANEIVCLYRHHVYHEDTPAYAAELLVRKARGARTGTMDLHWDGSTMTFRNA